MKEKKEKSVKKTTQENTNKKEKKAKISDEKKPNKFIEIIKKRWLIDSTKTFLLVLIIIAAFIGINFLMQKLELTPIDFSQEKLYTLTEESKEKVKNIDKNINIYFVGYSEDNSNLELAKQYHKANEKIVVEAVEANNRPDLVSKYGIESGTEGIIVECGEKSKVLTENDLVTYDTSTYETISIAEEKFTSSIISVSSEKIPKIYFLVGYSEFTSTENMRYLNVYLENEVNEIETLNILSTGKVPDDCDTLIITTPNKDFDDVATQAIIDYINSGRNILWLNAAITESKEMANVNKILNLYGVKPFEIGIIRETNSNNMVANTPDLIIPETQYATVTKDIVNSTGAILVNATKINIDTDALDELKVEETDLLLASKDSYFRTNFSNQSNSPSSDEEKGTFVVGAELNKTIKEANETNGENKVESKLIIYGENYFISDYQLSQSSQYGAIQLGDNKDLILNSIAYLVDREEDITARKSTGTVTYTATEQQDIIVKAIIFIVPIVIIIIGIVIWIIRRRTK